MQKVMPRKQRLAKSGPWRATREQRRMVEALHACGMPIPSIARVLGVGVGLLARECRQELDESLAKANARVAQFLYNGILGSPEHPPFESEDLRVRCAIFWLKTRAGWKETIVHENLLSVAEMSDQEVAHRLQIEEAAAKGENVVTFKR